MSCVSKKIADTDLHLHWDKIRDREWRSHLQGSKHSTTTPMIDFFTSDLSNEVHANAILSLMEEFASGLSEGGEGLPEFTKDHLIPELDRRDNCHLLLGMDDDAPVGVTIFFEVFSSFVCKPVLKIHDSRSAPTSKEKGW
jgi:hypothetical protein